jgi:hypothetical protein
MAALAHEAHRVTLLGVLLGEDAIEPHPLALVGADGLRLFLNPTDEPGAACRELGAERGGVRSSAIRGFVGISETYFPIRDFASVFCARPDALRKVESETVEGSAALGPLLDALVVPPPRLERILVVGYSPALPWLLRGIARSVPAIDVRVVLAVSSGEDVKLERWLDSLRYGLEAPASDGETLELPRGGRVTVSTYVGPDRTGFADDVLGEHGADAVVFLSDADAPDADARVSLQALKLVRAACRSGHLETRRRLHLLVELGSMHRGELLRRDLEAIAQGSLELEITRVSTEELKSYFMVQGAIVPGILGLYESLLGEPGQSLALLAVESSDAAPRRYGELREALGGLGCVPIALRLADGSLVTNPRADASYSPRDLRAIFGVADVDALAARLAGRRAAVAEQEKAEPAPTAA